MKLALNALCVALLLVVSNPISAQTAPPAGATQSAAAKDRVPKFEDSVELVGDVWIEWALFKGHPLKVSDKADGRLDSVGWMDMTCWVKGNHNDFMEDEELDPGEYIGIVMHPLPGQNQTLKNILIAILATMIVVVPIAYWLGRRSLKQA